MPYFYYGRQVPLHPQWLFMMVADGDHYRRGVEY